MRYADSHCHLHDERVIDDIEGIACRAATAGVDIMASCATAEDNFQTTLSLSKNKKSIIPFLGVHPWFINSRSNQWKSNLENLLEKNLAGVGETGLDFTDKTWDREDQMAVFETHLKLAVNFKRPINIHIRKAWDAFIYLLKKTGPLPVPGLVHSYSGSGQMVNVLEKYNLYISFSGSVTRPNARKVVEALNEVSLDRMVLETDAPDIMPTSDHLVNNHLNEPANLPLIAEIAAKRRGMAVEDFVSQVYENAQQLFASVLPKERIH